MSNDARDPAAIKEATREILNRPEFRDDKNWFERLVHMLSHPLQTLGDAVNWILLHLPLEGATVSLLAWVIAIVVAITVGFLLFRFGRSTSRDAGVNLQYVPMISGRSPAELLNEAAELEKSGEWRAAIRLRYGALLLQLAIAGLVKYRDGRTTGEYLNELATNAPRASGRFAAATSLFEWVWYGGGNAQEPDLIAFRSNAEAVIVEAGR